MPTNSPLLSFLTNVAMDPKASKAFQRDSAGALNAAGLSATDKAAITSKDPVAIRNAVLKEKGIAAGAIGVTAGHGGAAAAGDTEVVLVIVI